MLTAAGAALALAQRVPPVAVGAALLAIHRPAWFLAAAAVWGLVQRRRRIAARPEDESAFLRGLAAELASGASLRAAVAAAADRAPALRLERAVRLSEVGRPALEIGTELQGALPVNGEAAAAAFRLAARTGGPSAPVFETLARRAEAEGSLRRERSALTAQARLSAWLVGGLPIALAAAGLATGAGPDLSGAGPIGTGLAATGLGLIGLGGLTVWWIVRRAGR